MNRSDMCLGRTYLRPVRRFRIVNICRRIIKNVTECRENRADGLPLSKPSPYCPLKTRVPGFCSWSTTDLLIYCETPILVRNWVVHMVSHQSALSFQLHKRFPMTLQCRLPTCILLRKFQSIDLVNSNPMALEINNYCSECSRELDTSTALSHLEGIMLKMVTKMEAIYHLYETALHGIAPMTISLWTRFLRQHSGHQNCHRRWKPCD